MSLLKSALKGLAVLAALSGTQAQDLITDDAYFYGLSPPVYPSRMYSMGLTTCHHLFT